MTAPSLQGASADQHHPTGIQLGTRLGTAAAATSGRAALAALAAGEATTSNEVPAELDQFIDELAAIVHCPITVYQRELLQAALLGTIDARFTSLLARLPA